MSDTETETLELRALIAPNIDEALRKVCLLGEEVKWDSGYAMFPSGPGQVTCHGMIILHAKSPILGDPAHTFSIVTVLHDLLDPDATLEIMRRGMEGLRNLRAQALRGPINGSPLDPGIPPIV